ncbi:hypothetical protein AB4851_06195 [Burkholderia sp. 22PA0099]|uniref:hypothetical protein n=1 Tax=unclassified Burkholderia TaxID=2613784 RepID=UPI0039C2B81C
MAAHVDDGRHGKPEWRGIELAMAFRLADAPFAIALHVRRALFLRRLSEYFFALPGNRGRTARHGFAIGRSRM